MFVSRNSEGVATVSQLASTEDATLSGLRLLLIDELSQGCQSATWAAISQRFQRYRARFELANALLEREVLFQSDVEALIGKRPYEEKRPLAVDDTALADEPEQPAVVTEKKEERKSTNEQTGDFGLAPSI